jgi:divalent metal cation (Fe/Co/Zn/Cd) transporter
VVRIIHMRTLHIGPDELLVGAKIHFEDDLDVPRISTAIDTVEAAIREALPTARVIYIEPDVTRESMTDPTRRTFQP